MFCCKCSPSPLPLIWQFELVFRGFKKHHLPWEKYMYIFLEIQYLVLNNVLIFFNILYYLYWISTLGDAWSDVWRVQLHFECHWENRAQRGQDDHYLWLSYSSCYWYCTKWFVSLLNIILVSWIVIIHVLYKSSSLTWLTIIIVNIFLNLFETIHQHHN